MIAAKLTQSLDRNIGQIALILTLALIYFITARIGFAFAPGEQITAIWPAAGVGLASLLLFGMDVWPGIFLGSLLSKISVNDPLGVSLCVAVANTVEPLIGAALMRRYVGMDHYLERINGVMGLWFFSAYLSTLSGALIGATAVWISGLQPNDSYSHMFLVWWLADAGGSLIVTPLLLVWGRGPYRLPAWRHVVEGAALMTLAAIAAYLVFVYSLTADQGWLYPFMLFPFVIWCALRFRQRGTTILTMGVANVVLSATLHREGPFSDIPVHQGLIIAQCYVMVFTMVGLVVCAAMSELITAEMRVRRSWQYVQSVIDHIPEPVFMKSRHHILTGGNRAMWDLLGGTADCFIGKSCDALFPVEEEARSFNEKYDRVFRTGKTSVSEEIFTGRDGRRHVLDLKAALIRCDHEEPSLVAIARDITARKAAEEQLMQYTHDLENSNHALDDFAYIASHDLKEPLRGMQFFARCLLEDYGETLPSEARRKLERISELTVRLDSFLNVLLHYSQLGRTALAIEKTDLDALVRKSLDVFAINFEAKKVEVDIRQKLPVIECDAVRITEVFRNLVGNALKYTDKEKNKIEIGFLTNHPRAPGETVYYVKDEGIGIPPEFLDQIFRIFKRLHSRDAYGGGTGAGLAIVKKIIEQHGGDIWAESAGRGQGATFLFTLPQKKPDVSPGPLSVKGP